MGKKKNKGVEVNLVDINQLVRVSTIGKHFNKSRFNSYYWVKKASAKTHKIDGVLFVDKINLPDIQQVINNSRQ